MKGGCFVDNTLTSVEKDTISRNRIVSETDANFFVEAGAGSGKTTMLVNRMVAMVEQGKDISKICAITFTKAAAGEFYDRFQKLLIERSNPDYVWEDKGYAGQLPKPTDESRSLCAKALENIDLCFMGTIDSFCSMVLGEHPFEAGIPSDAKIMSEDEATVLYKQQFVKICAGEHGSDLAELAKAFRGFYMSAEDVFIKAEKILMNNRNFHFNYDASKTVNIDKTFAAERDEIIAAMKCLDENRDEVKYQSESKNLAAWEKVSAARRTFRTKWSNNLFNVIRMLSTMAPIRVNPSALDTYNISLGRCFEPGGKKGAWLEFTPSKPEGVYGKLMALKYEISMDFLTKCIPILEEAMRDKGYMTFFDYLYYLRNMLREDAKGDGKLIRYIYDRHSYFLIDEFQDTNPMQAEVFFYLSSKNPVGEWNKCIPRPGSLFIVGDPKQSIYRFRSADVTSFLKVKKLFGENGGDILNLSRNFRSTEKLCKYFNRVFNTLLPDETEIQSKYEEIPLPDETKGEFQGVYTYNAYIGKAIEEHPGEDDPMQIVKIIWQIVDRDDLLITTNEDKTPRPIRYEDIMIITATKTGIGGIMGALNAADIPVKVEGRVPFDENEALKIIADYYFAIADASDDHALYRVLTNRINSYSDEKIIRFKQDGGRVSVASEGVLSDSANESSVQIADTMTSLRKLYLKALKLSPAAILSEIMDSIEVYKYASVDDLEVMYYTLELLRNAEKAGTIVTAKDGADYLKTIITNASGDERCLSLTESNNCVHMANLHKVKGLEAPVVILAAASTWQRPVEQRLAHGDTGDQGYIFSLGESTEGHISYTHFATDKYDDEKEKEKEACNAEDRRLIYVAATRARNALIISQRIRGKSIESKWAPIVEAGTPDFFDNVSARSKGVASSRAEGEAPIMVDDLYTKAKDESVLNDRSSEEVSFHIMNPSHAKIASKIEENGAEASVGDDLVNSSEEATDTTVSSNVNVSNTVLSEVHRFPALLGTMTHRLMEMIVSTKKSLNICDAIDEIIREYRTPANAPYEDKLIAALKSVADTMYAGGYDQSNGAPKDILTVLLNADECFCEVPFCYKEVVDGVYTIWNGIMDVIYKKDGKWHIIDYKTNADGTELDEKYKSQLEAYIKAFKETTGEDVADAMTYHIGV